MQQVNKELGVTLNVPSISTVDYPNRLSTVIAGSDLPDIIAVYILATTLPNLADFLNSACADLTPYLSGDSVKDYPNLANLPPSAWPPTLFNNKIMAVPVASGGIRSNAPILFARWGELDQAGISKISSVDDFTAIAKQLNNPNGNQWALGANKFAYWMTQVYAGPNNWRESGGKFTKDWEAPEFKQAVAVPPQTCGMLVCFTRIRRRSPGSPAGAQFYAGRFIFSAYASWSSYQTTWDRSVAADPNFKPRAVLPFSKDGNGRAAQFLGSGVTGIVALKKAPPDRLKELLGILNYLAAPMGTTEQLLVQYGVEGAEFTRDGNGNPVPTQQAVQDLAVPWKYRQRAARLSVQRHVRGLRQRRPPDADRALCHDAARPERRAVLADRWFEGRSLAHDVQRPAQRDRVWQATGQRLGRPGQGLADQRWRQDSRRIRASPRSSEGLIALLYEGRRRTAQALAEPCGPREVLWPRGTEHLPGVLGFVAQVAPRHAGNDAAVVVQRLADDQSRRR